MKRALLFVALAACSEPAGERLERDATLGAIETRGYRFTSSDGLLHVQEASADRLVLRASCFEWSFELERKDEDLTSLVVALDNLPRGFVLEGPVERMLEPDTWRVRFTSDRVVVTARAQPAADFTFLAFGDIQTGIRNFDDVIAKLNEHTDADFILFLGDATNDSSRAEFDAIDEAFSRIALPLLMTPGNHDVSLTGGALYQQRFGRASYTCTHKGARFTSIDSASATLAEALWPKLGGWLELGRAQPHVLFSHVPATEVLGVRSAQWDARTEAHRFTAASVDANVDLMLFGHIHSFDAYALGGIPTYISGGGGAIPERLDGIDRHFLKVHVVNGALDVEVVRVDP